MKSKNLLALLVLVFVAALNVKAEETYWSGYQPPVPEAFPKAYKDYQILPGTISPNGKLAVIYPKLSRLNPEALNGPGLYLAQFPSLRLLFIVS